MDKKFLSAEEAIAQFGLDSAEFQRLVDEGEVRALADRGTWKYRRDEIVDLIGEGLLQAKHPTGDGRSAIESDSKTPVESVSFLEIDEEALAEGAAAHEASAESSADTTPSEVYLVDEKAQEPAAPPPQPAQESVSDVRKGSVSDVQLVTDPAPYEPIALPKSPSANLSEADIGTVEIEAVTDVPVAESLSELDIVIANEAPIAGDSSVIHSADDADKPESDSDVKVVPEAAQLAGSSADHAVAAADSGIALSGSEITKGSGSEIAKGSSDSDVRIVGSGVISAVGDDSGISVGGSSVAGDSAFLELPSSGVSPESSSVIAGDSAFLASDSGISLGSSSVAGDSAFLEKEDSGISLDAADSGISLESSDSGISLESGDSGISAAAQDSGISVDTGDSGLTLEAIADSGISLEADSGVTFDPDSGIQLDARTARPKGPKRPVATDVEMPGMDSAEIDSPNFGDSSEDTTMLVTEDDDALETIAPSKGQRSSGLSGSIAEEVEELDIAEDLDAGELDVEAIDEDEDELVEDVLEASDEVFATEESGELSGELSADRVSAVSSRSMMLAGQEPAWDLAAVIPVVACAVLLAVTSLMLWEGVATMWTGSEPAFAGALIEPLSGLF